MPKATIPDMPHNVAKVFDSYPAGLRTRLLSVRRMIFEVAARTEGVGELTETLKWGEPAYLTEQTRAGTTIRLGCPRDDPNQYAIYVNCNTDLIGRLRRQFDGHLTFDGNRAIRLDRRTAMPRAELHESIAAALSYHLAKRAGRKQRR